MPGGKSSTMPDDLVERLRAKYPGDGHGLGDEAAGRITALTARLAALEQATGEDVVTDALCEMLAALPPLPDSWPPGSVRHAVVAVLSAVAPTLRAQALQPIETAPRDRPIIVYAPARDGLPEMASMCQWHPDAGFCIDEIREPTHWMEKPTIRAGGSGG